MHGAGFRTSKIDPCVHYLYKKGRLIGICCWHVDDLMMGGDESAPEFRAARDYIKHKWKFRKWKVGEGKFCGTELRQEKDGTIHQNQKEFAESMTLPKCARTEDLGELSEEGMQELRSANGSVVKRDSRRRSLAALNSG